MCKSWSRIALSALVATACWYPAWAADKVQTVAPPIAPGKTVTVVKQSGSRAQLQHEAIADVRSEPPSEIIVKTEPPKPKPEAVRMDTRPSAGYIWVSGYWRWDTERGTYEWVPGVWRRQVPGMVWYPGRWEHSSKGYGWVAGFWGPEKAQGKNLVVVKDAPPSPRVEVEPDSPGADYVWIPGHWDFKKDRYEWTTGRWERPARQDMVYVPGEWVRRGDGFVYILGRWDYPEENRSSVATIRERERERDHFRDDERQRDPDNF